MGLRIESRLVVDALKMALAGRRPGEGLVAHSNRGSQYASEHEQGRLARHGIVCSMSRRANCWDNASMESFFASLKQELTHGERFATREQAKASLFESIEVFFNRVRRHSSLGYMSPAEYEMAGRTLTRRPPSGWKSSVALSIDIGLTDGSRLTPDMPLYTLRNVRTGETRTTTDPGRALLTGRWRDIGKFKGPVLRGLAACAPYFHNGLAADLGEVVEFYDTRFSVGFTGQEKADLIAFRNSL